MKHSVFKAIFLKEIKKRHPKKIEFFQYKINNSFGGYYIIYIFILKEQSYKIYFDNFFDNGRISKYSSERNEFIEIDGYEKETEEILGDLIKEHDILFESKKLSQNIPAAKNKNNKKVNKI